MTQDLGLKSWGDSSKTNWQIANKKKNQPNRNEELEPAGLGIPWVEWVWEGRLGGGAPVGEEGRELGGQAAKQMRGGQLPMPESFLSFGAWQPHETKIQLSERFPNVGRFPDLLKPGRCTIEVATVGVGQLHLLFPGLSSSRSLQTLLHQYLKSPRSGDGVPEPPLDELQQAMKEILEEHFADSDQTQTAFCDCRTSHKITIPTVTRLHTGQHPLIVRSVCDLGAMPQWLDWAVTKIDVAVALARRYHKTRVRIVVYAARGIRQAPAFALILHHMLQASLLHSDIEIKTDMEHLCRRIMEERQCGLCQDCSAQSATRSAALLNIRNELRQLSVKK